MQRRNARLVAAVAALGIALAAASSAVAVSSGETIQFVIPALSSQPEPDGGPVTDKLIFVGRKTTTSPGTGCVPTGSYPVQNAVLVDPAGGGSERIVGVITTFQEGGGSDPIPPGTKITNILSMADCSIAGDAYKKYTGTVE